MENKEDKAPYRVVINVRDTYYAQTEKEAWSIIGSQPFGSGHVVYDEEDRIRPEFVPF